jgi:hypothetical protein
MRNRYRRDCIRSIKQDADQHRTPTHQHLREYIAASVLAHCADGWSYLGRAMHAHLRGDSDCCRHLAYYAELRAAMALLAAGGIGVFLDRHIVVDSNGRCHCISGHGTHKFAWEALNHWAETTGARDLVLTIIRPGKIPLRDWLDQFAAGPANQTLLARDWLQLWGLDLERLTEDRSTRNRSSYRPTAFSSPGAAALTDVLAFVKEFWELNEPLGTLAFARLDRHLLRESISEAFRRMQGRSRRQAHRQFGHSVTTLLQNLPEQPLGPPPGGWDGFLSYASDPARPSLFEDARGRADILHPNHPRQVMARATLLLRLSSGAAEAGLRSLPNMDANELEFWWSRLGEDRCLWHHGEAPQDFVDLWADVGDALGDVREWEENTGDHERSYARLWHERPRTAAYLGSCERVALWGLGL